MPQRSTFPSGRDRRLVRCRAIALRALVAALSLALAACDDDRSPAPPSPTAVKGSLDLERSAGAGPPDAGTQAGHGGDRFVVTADGPTATVTGTVRPRSARIRLTDTSRRRTARVNVAPDGSFTAALPDLPRGEVVIFDLTATLPGAAPWKTQIAASRSDGRGASAPRERVVPRHDSTPPTATLLFKADGRTVSSISPVRPDKEPPVRLRSPVLTLTALVRDDDGGTGRIRVSLTYERECRDRETGQGTVHPVTHYFPPSEIARVKLVPGTRAPTERIRRATVRLEAGGGSCVIRGKAWADATNASGLESFSDQVPFVLQIDAVQ